jgi:hypothetical protein
MCSRGLSLRQIPDDMKQLFNIIFCVDTLQLNG